MTDYFLIKELFPSLQKQLGTLIMFLIYFFLKMGPRVSRPLNEENLTNSRIA